MKNYSSVRKRCCLVIRSNVPWENVSYQTFFIFLIFFPFML